MHAVFALPLAAGAHAVVLPALSTVRKWTMYLPTTVNCTELPTTVALQVEPLFDELRYS
jgi:hypothetical protein